MTSIGATKTAGPTRRAGEGASPVEEFKASVESRRGADGRFTPGSVVTIMEEAVKAIEQAERPGDIFDLRTFFRGKVMNFVSFDVGDHLIVNKDRAFVKSLEPFLPKRGWTQSTERTDAFADYVEAITRFASARASQLGISTR